MTSYRGFGPDFSAKMWPVHSLEHVPVAHRTCSVPSIHSKAHWFKPEYCLSDVWTICSPLSVPAAAGSDPCCLREPFPLHSASKSHPCEEENYQESPYKGQQTHPGKYNLVEYYLSHPQCPNFGSSEERLPGALFSPEIWVQRKRVWGS